MKTGAFVDVRSNNFERLVLVATSELITPLVNDARVKRGSLLAVAAFDVAMRANELAAREGLIDPGNKSFANERSAGKCLARLGFLGMRKARNERRLRCITLSAWRALTEVTRTY